MSLRRPLPPNPGLPNQFNRPVAPKKPTPPPPKVDWRGKYFELKSENDQLKETIELLKKMKKNGVSERDDKNQTANENEESQDELEKMRKRIKELEEANEKLTRENNKLVASILTYKVVSRNGSDHHETSSAKIAGNQKTPINSLRKVVTMPEMDSLNKTITKNSNSKDKKRGCTLTIKTPEVTHTTTILDLQTPISDVILKCQTKFPGDTSNYNLYMLKSRKSWVLLDTNRKISSYKELLDPKKAVVYFQTEEGMHAMFGKQKKKSKKVDRKNIAEAISSGDALWLNQLLETENEKTKSAVLERDENGYTSLHSAIITKKALVIDPFLKFFQNNGLDINVRDNAGHTPLHIACMVCSTGSEEEDHILRSLLEIPSIMVDIENNDNNLPLHLFCEKTQSANCQEIGRTLVSKAPITANKQNKIGETPIHRAMFNTRTKMLLIKLLIENGADVNIPTLNGETALHYAVKLGRKDLIKLLLHAGADIKAREGKDYCTPYEIAVNARQPEIAEILKNVDELQQFLNKLNLREHFLDFVKHDIYLDSFSALGEKEMSALFDKLNITALGARVKIQKAAADLKTKARPKNQNGKKERQFNTYRAAVNGSLINHSDLEFTKELGIGSYGKVFKGLFKGMKVAIKVLKVENKKGYEEFRKECDVLSVIDSPHIVHFFGACLDPKICVVIEYCKNGSLHNYLQKDIEFDWKNALDFSIGILKGLQCLHKWNPPIFHRDVKSENVLIDANYKVKLCDMGLARFNTERNHSTLGKVVGTYAYLAPELFFGQKFTEKADIYSVGILLWEIGARVAHGKYCGPFSEFPQIKLDFQIAIQAAENKLRPTIPDNFPKEFANLVKQTFDPEAEARPTVTEALVTLESIRNSMQEMKINYARYD